MTNGGKSVFKEHAGFAAFEDKDRIHKFRIPVAGSGSLLGHLRKSENEVVTNDSIKKKNILTINNQPTQLSIAAFLGKTMLSMQKSDSVYKLLSLNFQIADNRSCDDLQSLFGVMLPDSEMNRKMRLQKDKCKYAINHGIEPHCKQFLIQNVTASPCLSLSFNESSIMKIQLDQIDLYVRFWNASKELAET